MRKSTLLTSSILILFVLFTSCKNQQLEKKDTYSDAEIEAKKLNNFLSKSFQEYLALHPVYQTKLGYKDNYDKWDDISDSAYTKDVELLMKQLKELKENINIERLDKNSQISYRVFEQKGNSDLDLATFYTLNYPINPVDGYHLEIPSVLIHHHTIANEKEAKDYISRVTKVDDLIGQLVDKLKNRESYLLLPPKHFFPKIITTCNEILKGKPFDQSPENNIILNDFIHKVQILEIEEHKKAALITECEKELIASFKPGYAKLISTLQSLQSKAKNSISVSKLPNGQEYYQLLLDRHTDSYWVPEQMEDYGKKEIARIKAEMQQIMAETGFKGTVKDFYVELIKNPAALNNLQELIEKSSSGIEKISNVKIAPQKVSVKNLEEFHEECALNRDFSKPFVKNKKSAILLINNKALKDAPAAQLNAISLEAGYPGKQFQSLVAQGADLPDLRKYGEFLAYENGWGLYSTLIAKESGMIKDSKTDFFRLNEELWRSCNLVVEAGIHFYNWDRKKAMEFYRNNSLASEEECSNMIDWQITYPGQISSYKMGMMKLQDLRAKAKNWKGEIFDLKEFHDLILTNGPAPLTEVEIWVRNYANVRIESFAPQMQNNL